jgi:hypothetical protein
MKRFVKGIKNSQKIRVLIKDNETGSDFGVFTTVRDVFEGNCFVLDLHTALTTETLEQLGNIKATEGCQGIVWGFFDHQVQINLLDELQ